MPWERVPTEVDGEKKEYWWNTETDETSWTVPDGVDATDVADNDAAVPIEGPVRRVKCP